MRILLVNVSSTLTSDGCRLVSALLKRAGHTVRSVFMARSEPHAYDERELEPLEDLLKASDLVMVGVYSSYALRAVQVTGFVRKRCPGMTIVWGGPHCISVPELGLRHADGICFSEGDEAVVELVRRMEAGEDYRKTPNMAFRKDGTHVVNEILPPFSDLDSLPCYDYDLDDQFLLNRGLVRMTRERFRARAAGYPYYIPTYYFTTSRGCPHRCSYCNNCRYVAMQGRNPMRFHSVERVIRELESTLEHLDFFRIVGFGDDDFFMRPKRDIARFAEQYRRRIGLPFGVAVSANTYHREKMELLLEGGLKFIQMGVQSGSQRVIDEVYQRGIQVRKTRRVVEEIASCRAPRHLDVLLDFIVDNPYETREDILETYRYIVDLPLHVKVNIFLLAFFPGTPIYERALGDGIIEPFDEKAFRFYIKGRVQYQRNYETFLILLERYLRRRGRVRRHLPPALLRMMAGRLFRNLGRLLPGSTYASLSGLVQ
jgi:radical SAM superfamily enzyme YgiQ (UPF0313 family)